MTDEPREKQEKQFEKENKRLIEENKELQNQIVKILQDAIAGAEKIYSQIDEPIQKAAIAADLAYQAETSARKVADLAIGASEIVGKVSANAKNVEDVANKVAQMRKEQQSQTLK